MPDMFYNAVGFLGPILFTWAYLQVSLGKWDGGMTKTHVYNLVGAAAILISLTRFWNAPVFVLELAWAAISIYGIYRCRKA